MFVVTVTVMEIGTHGIIVIHPARAMTLNLHTTLSAGIRNGPILGSHGPLITEPSDSVRDLWQCKRYKNTSNIVVVKRSDKLHLNQYCLTMSHLIASEVTTHSES